MSNYVIHPYTLIQAAKLGVIVLPSNIKHKKLDVYKNGVLVAHIGDVRYQDYPTYIKTHGIDYANNRRALYHARHKYDTGIDGFYAKHLLW